MKPTHYFRWWIPSSSKENPLPNLVLQQFWVDPSIGPYHELPDTKVGEWRDVPVERDETNQGASA